MADSFFKYLAIESLLTTAPSLLSASCAGLQSLSNERSTQYFLKRIVFRAFFQQSHPTVPQNVYMSNRSFHRNIFYCVQHDIQPICPVEYLAMVFQSNAVEKTLNQFLVFI